MATPLRQGQWRQEIVDLADCVRPEPLVIDAVWQRLRSRYGVHLRRDTGMGELDFLREALQIAEARHFLRAFWTALMAEGLVDETSERRIEAVVGESAYVLNAFQNAEFKPTNALVAARGMLLSCERVCRITVGEQHSGTGVLVSPTLVATSAHVVTSLVRRLEDGTLQALPDSLRRLSLTFGDVEDYLPDLSGTRRREGQVAVLHELWLAWGSTQTANETSKALFDVRDVAGITEADGPWDVALIRLAAPRPFPKPLLRTTEPPTKPFQINVLHHPGSRTGASEPLLWSIGKLDEQLGTPAVRYLHDANTVGGSSGAPVFDHDWRVVALHQGGSRDVASVGDAAGLAKLARNRAVPVCRWLSTLDRVERASQAVPYLKALPGPTGEPQPVIGRQETQQRVWRAMWDSAEAAHRVLIVRGEPGLGLAFTKRLVSGLVGRYDSGVVVTLDVTNTVELDATGFAELVVAALSARLGCATDGLSTWQSEVRTTVAPALGRKLEQLAGRRPVWLVVEGFERARVNDQQGVDNLLLSLCLHFADYPSLRLVLVGWQQTPPEEFAGSVEDLEPPTARDITQYCLPAVEEPDPVLVAITQSLLDAEIANGHRGYAAALLVVAKLRALLGKALGVEGGAW